MVTGMRGLCNGLGPAVFGLIFYVFHVDLNEDEARLAAQDGLASPSMNSTSIVVAPDSPTSDLTKQHHVLSHVSKVRSIFSFHPSIQAIKMYWYVASADNSRTTFCVWIAHSGVSHCSSDVHSRTSLSLQVSSRWCFNRSGGPASRSPTHSPFPLGWSWRNVKSRTSHTLRTRESSK